MKRLLGVALVFVLAAGARSRAAEIVRGLEAPTGPAAPATFVMPAPVVVAPVFFGSPLAYQARLERGGPTLGVGAGFLGDARAQEWFKARRPEALPELLHDALAQEDVALLLGKFVDGRALREAILARPDAPFARRPSDLLKIVDANPALAGRRPIVSLAMLEWESMRDDTRERIVRAGYTRETYQALNLADREELMRAAIFQIADEMVTAPIGSEEHAQQLAAALERSAAVLTYPEIDERSRRAELAQRIFDGLQRAEAAASAAAAGRAKQVAGLLAQARAASSLEESAAALDRAFGELGLPSPAGELTTERPTLGLSPRDHRRFTQAFVQEVFAQLREDADGAALAARFAADAVRFDIGEVPWGAGAAYSSVDHSIIVSETFLAAALKSLDLTPQRALADPAALRDAVSALAPIIVHEGTHHLQHVWAREKTGQGSFDQVAYGHHAELEAFLAEAVYTQRRLARDPAFAALAARVRATPDSPLIQVFSSVDQLRDRPGDFEQGFLLSYRNVPTLARAAARIIAASGEERELKQATIESVRAELARRRRLSAVERRRLESAGVTVPTDSDEVTGYATSFLRRWLRLIADERDSAVALALALREHYTQAIARLTAELGGPISPASAPQER